MNGRFIITIITISYNNNNINYKDGMPLALLS